MSSRKKIDLIINMLKDDQYIRIYGSLFNLLLVKYGARKAYLLESAEFHGTEYTKYILNISSNIGLCKTDDILTIEDYPRYWIHKGKLEIPKTDEEIGELLGMKNPGRSYFDYTKKRLSLDIIEEKTGSSITTELLSGDIKDEDNKIFAKNKVDSFNKVMKSLNLPYTFVYILQQDDGSEKRLQELERRNINYIRKNINNYINDINNCIVKHDDNPIEDLFKRSISIYKNNSLLFNKFVPLFIYIYKVFNDEVASESQDFKTKIQDIHNKFIDLIELNLTSRKASRKTSRKASRKASRKTTRKV